MNNKPSATQGVGNNDLAAGIRNRAIQVVATLLIQALILFLSAGKLDWGAAWVLLGVHVCILLFNMLVIVPRNPEMVAERGRVKENTKGWDKLLTSFLSIFALLTLVVAGLNARFGWPPLMVLWLQVVGLVLVALGQLLFSWSMASNKFFSGVVRIQDDRGHSVATGGPYRYVRHPGYIGYITFTVGAALALGSFWALVPAAITGLVLVVRTALEDRTLLAELDGYQDYARQVRYRLLPGVW